MRQSSVMSNVPIKRVCFAEIVSPQETRRQAEDAETRRRAEAEALARARAEKEACRQAEAAIKVREAFDAGYAKGQAAAVEKLERLAHAFRAACIGLRTELESEAENQAVRLAVDLAEVVIRTQVQFDEAVLRASLTEALARTPAENVLRICVNPDDLAAARELGAALRLEQAEVVADPTVGRGGCIAHTALGLIDSTVEHRWEAARQVLLQTINRTVNDER